MNVLGMIEVNSIAAGIEVGDVMLKTAGVELLTAQPVCPGKYVIIVQGGVAEVKSSVDAGVLIAKNSMVDSMLIPNMHPQVYLALSCATEIKKRDAIGVIEAFSLVTAVLAADTSVKAANVDLVEIRLGRGLGGKSFVVMTGNVSAVKHAVETVNKQFCGEGMLVRTVVVPSPHENIMNALL